MSDNKVLLKVEHLEQFFSSGKYVNKAVNDVSFEIYKGEVFGLVGESGCGKTTTGRSIIRLYDITGGSVYFDGKRICAGIRPYKQAIKDAKTNLKNKSKELVEEMNNAISKGTDQETAKTAYLEKLNQLTSETNAIIEKNMAEIVSAKYDHKNCNKEFAKHEVQKVNARYDALLKNENAPLAKICP